MDASVSPPERGLPRLKRRREFLAAAKARKSATPGFVLQARRRRADEQSRECAYAGARIGFTASKKVGNAVARNRAKRRLRALADELGPVCGRPGWDYVLIARAETTATRDFARMRAEMIEAFARAHEDRKPAAPRRDRREEPPGGARDGAS